MIIGIKGKAQAFGLGNIAPFAVSVHVVVVVGVKCSMALLASGAFCLVGASSGSTGMGVDATFCAANALIPVAGGVVG